VQQPWGPAGKVRPTGASIALFVVTLGIYGFVYNYSVHDEMKRHSGRGIGGGVALLLSFLAGVAMPFVTPAEVGSLYSRRGFPEPVNGWTGLWYVGPAIAGYLAFFVLLFATVALNVHQTTHGASAAPPWHIFAGVGIAFLVYVAALAAGGIAWFVKTNGALNRYWESLRR
jgi:hypothetical protein